MKWSALACLLGCLAISTAAKARDYIWYDAGQQAIAIDLYAYDYGNYIEIDFDTDHATAGVVDQRFGDITFLGLRRVTVNEDYTAHFFGWSEALLVDAEPAVDFSTFVTILGDDTPATEHFHYFTPEWNPQAGKTIIYVRPAAGSTSIPVTPAMLSNVFVRLNEVEWQPLQALPLLMAPLAVEVSVSPGVFHLTRDGGSLNVQIKLPEPYAVADLDLTTVSLSVSSTVAVEDIDRQAVKISRKVAQAGDGGNKLIAKIDREALRGYIWDSSMTFFAVGRLRDGTPIRGSTTIQVVE